MTESTSPLVSGPVGLATGGGSITTTEGSGFAAMEGKDVGSITGVATGQVAAPEEQAAAIKLLREKYQQYQSMDIDQNPVIKITPSRITSWEGETPPI